MTRSNAGRRLRAWLAPVLLATAFPALAGAPLQPFTASYDVTYGSTRIGEARFTLEAEPGSNRYLYASRTEPIGLARLLAGTVTEASEFVLANGALQPLSFTSDDGTRKGKHDMLLTFDWSSNTARSTYKGSTETHEVSLGVMDRNLVQIALMHDLANGTPPGPYRILDKHSIDVYEFERAGEERVTTGAGSYETIKLRRHRQGSSRDTYIWLAPALDYLAVKMLQYKDGKPAVGMELTGAAPAADGG